MHTEESAAIAREGVLATNTVNSARGNRDDRRRRGIAEVEVFCATATTTSVT